MPVPSHSFPSLTYRILHDPFRTTGDVEISRLHNVAIRKEIGEQLAICMQPKPAGMPPHLMMLMRRLRDEPLSHLPAQFARFMASVIARDMLSSAAN